ncbi:macrolide family glycosyltransferase [Microseira wollei]|uniref:Glycosyl transferase family protein n=1 Tax=Microseira wollei NIES-4236 TaxID=2530354 RepID=A0AAV3XEJ8_9CYAN|nr:macrolide family glycosyltransferase [Microseira wollei]GET38797.1 glycosyl transferase family protein [Microseira wollei NIES-4236]
MSNIVFFNFQAYGHINPSLGIAQELVQRGEKVDYYCTEEFRYLIEKAGVQFQVLPSTVDLFSSASGKSYLIETSLEVLPILLKQFRQTPPKVLIFDATCLWGYLLGKLLKLPTVSTHASAILPPSFSPLISPELLLAFLPPHIFPVLPCFFPDSNFYTPLEKLRLVHKHRILWAQFRQQYQVEGLKINELFHSRGDLNIVFTSEAIQFKRELFDTSYIFVGRCYTNSLLDPDFSLADIKGKSVIYISLGTIFTDNIPFYKKCLLAFGYSNHLVVMKVGKSVDINLLGEIPPNFIVRNDVPPLEVLKYASVFISHASMTSTMEALEHRVPLVLFPQATDQYLVASRIEELGAGVWVKQQNIQPHKLRELVEKVMQDSSIRRNVERLGKSLVEAGGTQRAVDKILELKQRASTPK